VATQLTNSSRKNSVSSRASISEVEDQTSTSIDFDRFQGVDFSAKIEMNNPNDDYYYSCLAAATLDLLSNDPAFTNIPFPDRISLSEAKSNSSSESQSANLVKSASSSGNAIVSNVPNADKGLMVTSPLAFTPLFPLFSFSSIVPPRIRGSREDWLGRYKSIILVGRDGLISASQNHNMSNYITKLKFCNAMASTVTSKTVDTMDRLDRDIFYFLLFGKKNLNRATIMREYRYDKIMFHYMSKDEEANSLLRRQWLEDTIHIHQTSSELFLSQLQSSDLLNAAEKFWDNIIVKMSKECLQFPFLHYESNSSNSSPSAASLEKLTSPKSEMKENNPSSVADDASSSLPSHPTLSRPSIRRMSNTRRNSFQSNPHALSMMMTNSLGGSIASSGTEPDLSINWEVYREIILIGMKKYIEQFKSSSS
jgi:hypothetical protein